MGLPGSGPSLVLGQIPESPAPALSVRWTSQQCSWHSVHKPESPGGFKNCDITELFCTLRRSLIQR